MSGLPVAMPALATVHYPLVLKSLQQGAYSMRVPPSQVNPGQTHQLTGRRWRCSNDRPCCQALG